LVVGKELRSTVEKEKERIEKILAAAQVLDGKVAAW
jgi:hypothetical protein